ncbi:unnamed protein product, partial [Ixodes hexagonus]
RRSASSHALTPAAARRAATDRRALHSAERQRSDDPRLSTDPPTLPGESTTEPAPTTAANGRWAIPKVAPKNAGGGGEGGRGAPHSPFSETWTWPTSPPRETDRSPKLRGPRGRVGRKAARRKPKGVRPLGAGEVALRRPPLA